MKKVDDILSEYMKLLEKNKSELECYRDDLLSIKSVSEDLIERVDKLLPNLEPCCQETHDLYYKIRNYKAKQRRHMIEENSNEVESIVNTDNYRIYLNNYCCYYDDIFELCDYLQDKSSKNAYYAVAKKFNDIVKNFLNDCKIEV